MKYVTLSQKELQESILKLPQWKYIPDKPALYREFRFATFLQAIEFMYLARIYIDTLNHHPEWTNVYNTITVTLYTHEVNAITTLDVELANYLTELYQKI